MTMPILDVVDTAPVVGWNNDLVLVPLRSARTATGYAVFEIVALPGAGFQPPGHAEQDMAFYVLEGEWTFECAGDTRMVGVDQAIFVRRDSVHAFANTGAAPGRLLVVTWSGDAAGCVIRGRPVAGMDLVG